MVATPAGPGIAVRRWQTWRVQPDGGGEIDVASQDRAPRSSALLLVDAVFALSLAVLLTLCDGLAHVAFGVLSYTEPTAMSLLPRQPTLQVFAGFLLLSILLTAALRLLFGSYPSVGLATALLLIASFVLSYFASGLLGNWPGVLFVGFLVLWAAQLRWFRQRLPLVVGFCVVLALLGPVVEGVYSATGFFGYADSTVFGVPVWLGTLYLNGGLAAIATYALLRDALRRRVNSGVVTTGLG